MLARTNALLSSVPGPGILILCLALVVLLGLADYFTRSALSTSALYLVPVAVAAWYGRRRDGLSVAWIASLVWALVQLGAGMPAYSAILIWNTGVQCALCGISCAFLRALRARLSAERELARKDPLTGVFNARAFRERLEYSLALFGRGARPLTVAYIDLDDFKRINDTAGHPEGDRVLTTLAHTLAEATRCTDTVARLGGDEFALLLPGTDAPGAVDVVSKLRSRLSEALQSRSRPVTCSIGVVTFTHTPRNADEVVRAADRLMYQVKTRGKNAVSFAVFDTFTGALVGARLPRSAPPASVLGAIAG
jgi:diguanylate cyclase (GGDEF)-like protein